jgi:hypothetical protein
MALRAIYKESEHIFFAISQMGAMVFEILYHLFKMF